MEKWEKDKWGLIHTYRSEYLSGGVPWIQCPDCGYNVRIVSVDKSDDPALRCDVCHVTYRPGSATWDQLRSNLNEVFEVEHVEG